jgi:hypothetical protein
LKRLVALAVVALAALWLAVPGLVAAQGGIVVDSTDATNDFPDGVTFKVSLHSDADITKVVFRYVIPPEGASVYEEPECSGTRAVQCTFNLKSNAKLFLVPGANVIYRWQAEDAAGNTLETEQATFVYEDTRFDWTSMTDGNLTIWYYAGSESDVRSLLQTGVEGLVRMEELLGARVGFPVKVYLYASAEDMREAALSASVSPSEGVITLGEVFFSDTAVVSADVVPEDVLRHELAHIVIRQAVKGPFGNLPAWLDEGTATYAQSELFANEKRALESAIADDDVLSLRSMSSGSFAHTSGGVSVFYAQSWSVVSFLIDEYGEEKFAELFATFKEGSTVDKAFQQVYGFDLDGLENAWRESAGLPAKETSGQQGQTTPVPQLTPFDGSSGGSEQETTEGGGGFPVAAIAGLAALAVVVVGGAVVFAARRRG